MKTSMIWMAGLLMLTLGGTLPAAAPAVAEEPTNRNARAFLASLGEQAIQVARDKTSPSEDREARIRALLREGFDLKLLARFTLGKHWRRMDQGQRAEFVEAFTGSMVRQTLTFFGSYRAETFDITGAGADRTNPKLIAITVAVMRSDGTLLAKVKWRIRKHGARFKIVDIIVEGVSLALTLRQEYRAVIERSEGRVDGLIASFSLTAVIRAAWGLDSHPI